MSEKSRQSELALSIQKSKIGLALVTVGTICKVAVAILTLSMGDLHIFLVTAPIGAIIAIILAAQIDEESALFAQISKGPKPRRIEPLFFGFAGLAMLLIGATAVLGQPDSPDSSSESALDALRDNQSEFAFDTTPPGPDERLLSVQEGPRCDEYLNADIVTIEALPRSCVYQASPEVIRSLDYTYCRDQRIYELDREDGSYFVLTAEEDSWLPVPEQELDSAIDFYCTPLVNRHSGSVQVPVGSQVLVQANSIGSGVIGSDSESIASRPTLGATVGTTEISTDRSVVGFVPASSSDLGGQIGVWELSTGREFGISAEPYVVTDVAFGETETQIFFIGVSEDSDEWVLGVAHTGSGEITVLGNASPDWELLGGATDGVFVLESNPSQEQSFVSRIDPSSFEESGRFELERAVVDSQVINSGSSIVIADTTGVRKYDFDGDQEQPVDYSDRSWFAVSPDESVLVVSNSDSSLRLIQLGFGGSERHVALPELGGEITSVTWLPDSMVLAASINPVESNERVLVYIDLIDGDTRSTQLIGVPVLAFVGE